MVSLLDSSHRCPNGIFQLAIATESLDKPSNSAKEVTKLIFQDSSNIKEPANVCQRKILLEDVSQ